jgi:septal ring factor EnvC (AmiA/AmiB activator)
MDAKRTEILKLASEKEKEELLAKLDEIEKKISRYESEKETIKFSIKSTNQEIESLSLEEKEIQLQLKKKFLVFKKRIRSIYKRRSISIAEIVLSGKDISTSINRLNYLMKIARYDQEVFDALRVLISTIDKKKSSLEKKQAYLIKLKAQQENSTEELKNSLSEKQKFLTKIKHRIEVLEIRAKRHKEIAEIMESTLKKAVANVSDQELKKSTIAPVRQDGPGIYGDDSSFIDNKISGQDQAQDSGKSESQGDEKNKNISNLVWPAGNIEKVVELWGESVDKISNTKKINSGIKISLPEGTPIKASGDGIVVYKGRMEGYGLFVILNHGDDLTTVYACLDEAFVRVGKLVGQSEKIGISGKKEFHFEVRKSSVTQNPLNWLM